MQYIILDCSILRLSSVQLVLSADPLVHHGAITSQTLSLLVFMTTVWMVFVMLGC